MLITVLCLEKSIYNVYSFQDIKRKRNKGFTASIIRAVFFTFEMYETMFCAFMVITVRFYNEKLYKVGFFDTFCNRRSKILQ